MCPALVGLRLTLGLGNHKARSCPCLCAQHSLSSHLVPSFTPPRGAVRPRCQHSDLTWFLRFGRDPSYSTSFQLEGNTTHVREQFPMPVLP